MIKGIEFQVRDLSERGLRINTFRLLTLIKGERVPMKIKFAQGEQLDMFGCVLRVRESDVALHLSERIPVERIRADECALVKKYAYTSSVGMDALA